MLEYENIFTCRRGYANERKKILNTISKEELHTAKARRYFVDEKINFDDFSKLKNEHNEKLSQLNRQVNSITKKLADCERNMNLWPDTGFNVFRSYKEQDIKGKRDIISLFNPASINPDAATITSLKIDKTLSLIVECIQ